MSNHIWRQKHGRDPMREWMRRELPGSKEGVVLVDLDLAVRRYGGNFGLDSSGDLLMIEKKEYNGEITWGEKFVYRWIDDAIKSSPEFSKRWRGWYLLRIKYNEPAPLCETCHQPVETEDIAFERFMNATLYMDEKEITHDELKKFLLDRRNGGD